MKRIIVVALAVLGVSMAAAASASAQSFHATVVPGTLLGRATSNQVFTPFAGAGTITCKNAFTEGKATVTLGLHQLVSVFYSSCTAFGVFNVGISTAKYLLSADGLVAVENTIEIGIEGVCEITVKPQDLGTVKYKNSGKSIVVESSVTGIKSEGSGGPCGGPTNTGGTYTGNNEISEDGGAFSWG